MKKIFFILSLLISVVSIGQHKAGLDTNSTSFLGGVLVNTYFRPALDTLSTAPVGSFAYVGDKMWFKKADLFWYELTSGGVGYTNLTEFIDQANWKVFYSDGSGNTQELSIGAAGTFLGSNGATSVPSFQTVAAALTATQIGYGSGTNLLTGASDFVWDNTLKRLGLATATPMSGLNLVQIAGTGKGFLITGIEQFDNASGSEDRGYGFWLGVNRAGNVQGWQGSSENIATTSPLLRVLTSSISYPIIDGVAGDASASKHIGISNTSFNAIIGGDGTVIPANKLTVNGRMSVGTNVQTTVAPTDGILSEGQIQSEKEQKLKAITAPGTPAAGYGYLYIKSSDKKLYWKDDAGLETLAGGGSGGADELGTYIVQTATNAPANAQILASLGTGLVKNTTTTGVLSIAVPGTDYATVSGIHYEAAVKYATAAALAANTYNNGTSGVGATLTATGNGAISVDATTPSVNDRILVKNEATQANNGIYTVTQVGDAGNPYILTRATDFDQSAEIIEGDAVFVTAGSSNSATSWFQQTAGTITVGTTAIVFVQFNNVAVSDNSITNAKLAQMAAGTYKANITGSTANAADVTRADVKTDLGISNVENTALSTWAGSANLTTLGTIGTGTWQGAVIGSTYGGTGINNAGRTLTIGTNSGTINFAAGKALTVNNSITIAGTDATTMTFPSTSQDVVGRTAVQNITEKRITKRAPTVTQSATPAINTDITDVAHITGLAQAITSMTTNLTGTPVEGDELRIDITDDGTARAITWGASFENGAATLPTTTVAGVRLDIKFYWNSVTSKWRCMAAG